MANFIGNIREFNPKGTESFESYSERMDLYFAANEIVVEAKKKVTFLTLCGPDLYQLLRSLTAPGKPTDKTYQELTELVSGHLNPKPNVIVERYRFNSKVRNSGESVSEFVADLRHLSRHCEYEAKTDEMIRDRLVCGVNDMAIQRKLLAEVGLDLKKAVVIAKGMEMATREALKISGTREVHVLDHGKGRRETCFRCGDSRHRAPDCHFREKECFLCKKKGHISKVCSQRKKAGKAPNVNNLEGNEVSGASTSGCSSADALMGASRGIGGLVLRDFQSSEFNDEYTTFFINRTEVRKEAPILIRMKVDGDEVPMELDTGASISVTGKKEWEAMTGKSMQLEKTRIRLKTFGGKIIEPLGVSQVQVNYKGKKNDCQSL